MPELHYKDGGTWRKVFSGFALIGGKVNIDIFGSSTAPSVTYQTDGALSANGLTSPDSWGTPASAGVGSGYWINVASGSGTGTMSGTFGVWLQLSTARNWTMTAAPNGQSRDRTCGYQIATDAAGANVVASGSLVFISDRT